jgi:hypothetical protein
MVADGIGAHVVESHLRLRLFGVGLKEDGLPMTTLGTGMVLRPEGQWEFFNEATTIYVPLTSLYKIEMSDKLRLRTRLFLRNKTLKSCSIQWKQYTETFQKRVINRVGNPDLLFRGTDPDPTPDPFIIKNKTLISTVLRRLYDFLALKK